MSQAIAPAQTTEYVVIEQTAIEGKETTITVTSAEGKSTTHGFFECFMHPNSTDFLANAIMLHFGERSIGYSFIDAYKGCVVYEVTYAKEPIVIGGRVYEDI